MKPTKKILFVAAEAAPFIKTGGLGDVASALPKALVKLGADVRVIIPKYSSIPLNYKNSMIHVGEKEISLAWREKYLGIDMLTLDGITYYFVDNQEYFDRNLIYGEFDDCERFAFFSKSVIESFEITGFYPDVIHCNDWHSGLVPVYLNETKKYGHNLDIKSVFTIHNLRFQGVYPYGCIEDILGLLPGEHFHENGIKFYDAFSFMKGGVNYSDFVTTVSNTYAEEIKTEYYGEKLQDLFKHIEYKLKGIVNGIDYEVFNPGSDLDLIKNFSSEDFSGKIENKRKLQEEMGLTVDDNIPIVAIITRLDRQKGIDLITAIFQQLMDETDVQFILLGNGEEKYENFFNSMIPKFPGRVACYIGFNNKLAKEIYAGADIFLMPSQFEPCGLSQMISMRYGTVPLVRETGGLKDTVIPYNEYEDNGTGFTFKNYNAHDMLHVMKYALEIYRDKNKWNSIISRGMKQENSWKHSAMQYLSLYNSL